MTRLGWSTHPSNNAPRANGTPLANPHSRQDNHICRNPHIVLNHNRLAVLRALVAVAHPWAGAARARVDAHIGADNHVIPDAHLADIIDQTVPPNRDIAPDADVVPVVAVEGRLDGGVVADAACVGDGRDQGWAELNALARVQDVAEQAGTLRRRDAQVGVGRVVEAPAGGVAALALEDELLVEGVVGAAVEHLVLLAAHALRRGELRVGEG